MSMKIILPLALFALSLPALSQQQAPQCVQLPERASPCEHLLFKRQRIEGEYALACVCLQDFQALRWPAKTEMGLAQQTQLLESMAQRLGMPAEQLLDLVRY